MRLFLDAIRESRERDSRDRVDDTARHARLLVTWLRRGGRGANLEPGGEGLYAPPDMARPTRRILAKVLHLLPERERERTTDADDDARGTPADRENARERPRRRVARTRTRRSRADRGVSRIRLYSLRLTWTLWRRRRRDARRRRSETIAFGTSSGNAISPRTTRNSTRGRRRRREGGARGGGGRDDAAALAVISASAFRLRLRLRDGFGFAANARRGWRAVWVLPGSRTAFACFSPPPRSSSSPTRRSSNTGSDKSRGTFARPRRGAQAASRARRRGHVREGGVRVGGDASRAKRRRDEPRRRGRRSPGDASRARFPAGGDPRSGLRRRPVHLRSHVAAVQGGDRDDLLRVHFLRLIVDEGHLLGSAGSETTRAQRVRAIRAERRWIMTGTPAPAVRASERSGGARGNMSRAMATATHDVAAAPHRAAAALHPLLDLVRAAPFGSSRALWHDAVLRPLRERRPEGIATLREPSRGFWFARVRRSWGCFAADAPRGSRAVRGVARARVQPTRRSRAAQSAPRGLERPGTPGVAPAPRSRAVRQGVVRQRAKGACASRARSRAPQEHDLCETLTLLARRRGVPAPVAWDFTLLTDRDVDRGALAVVAGAEGLPANVASFAFAADETNGGGIGTGIGIGSGAGSAATTAATTAAGSYSAATVRDRGEERARRRANAAAARAHLPAADRRCRLARRRTPSRRDGAREGGACASCGDVSAVVLAPPCGCGVLCPSCAEPSPTRCAACGTPYDMQSTDHPDARFIASSEMARAARTHRGHPRAGADAMGHRGDTGRRIGDRRRVPKCRG